LHRLKIFGAFGDIGGIVQVFRQDDVHHAVDHRDIGAGILAQPQSGMTHQVLAAGIDDDQVLIFQASRSFDVGPDDRMVFGGVRADDQNTIRVLQLADGVGHGPGAVGSRQAGYGGGMAEAGAVIHVAGADDRAHHLLHQVVFFVGHPGRSQAAYLFRAVFPLDFREPEGHQIQGLIPGSLPKGAILFN
jgi:hypothetical protein